MMLTYILLDITWRDSYWWGGDRLQPSVVGVRIHIERLLFHVNDLNSLTQTTNAIYLNLSTLGILSFDDRMLDTITRNARWQLAGSGGNRCYRS
jgi:hypothetical protein